MIYFARAELVIDNPIPWAPMGWFERAVSDQTITVVAATARAY